MSDTPPLSLSIDSPPTGPAIPSAKEVQAMGVIGLDIGKAGRKTLMNQIGAALGIPPGGFHGQAKLFDGHDVRIVALLAKLAKEQAAKRIAANLYRAGRYTNVPLMLAAVTTAREHSKGLTASGDRMIDSFNEGGLDFLWAEKNRLGLPNSVTKPWVERLPKIINPETGNRVEAAWIPAHDEFLAYAAQIGASYNHNFKSNLKVALGTEADGALSRASRPAVLAWAAYAFLAPGGREFDPKKTLASQLGQHFGSRTALDYVAQLAKKAGGKPDLDLLIKDPQLNHTEWVRSAKTRAAETLFLERLLKRARELLPK
jgi:hypothetical protein